RRRHTRLVSDWSSDVCSSDLLLLVHGDFKIDGAGAVVEAVEVLAEAEDFTVVDADALEDAVAVEQPVVVDADLGLGLVVELAVRSEERRVGKEGRERWGQDQW